MINNLARGTVLSGYDTWINEPARAASGEVNFGAWWRTEGAYWRVSWIEDTGELCAAEVGKTDRFVFIGSYAKKEIVAIMHKWFDGDNLSLFIQKCIDSVVTKDKELREPADPILPWD